MHLYAISPKFKWYLGIYLCFQIILLDFDISRFGFKISRLEAQSNQTHLQSASQFHVVSAPVSVKSGLYGRYLIIDGNVIGKFPLPEISIKVGWHLICVSQSTQKELSDFCMWSFIIPNHQQIIDLDSFIQTDPTTSKSISSQGLQSYQDQKLKEKEAIQKVRQDIPSKRFSSQSALAITQKDPNLINLIGLNHCFDHHCDWQFAVEVWQNHQLDQDQHLHQWTSIKAVESRDDTQISQFTLVAKPSRFLGFSLGRFRNHALDFQQQFQISQIENLSRVQPIINQFELQILAIQSFKLKMGFLLPDQIKMVDQIRPSFGIEYQNHQSTFKRFAIHQQCLFFCYYTSDLDYQPFSSLKIKGQIQARSQQYEWLKHHLQIDYETQFSYLKFDFLYQNLQQAILSNPWLIWPIVNDFQTQKTNLSASAIQRFSLDGGIDHFLHPSVSLQSQIWMRNGFFSYTPHLQDQLNHQSLSFSFKPNEWFWGSSQIFSVSPIGLKAHKFGIFHQNESNLRLISGLSHQFKSLDTESTSSKIQSMIKLGYSYVLNQSHRSINRSQNLKSQSLNLIYVETDFSYCFDSFTQCLVLSALYSNLNPIDYQLESFFRFLLSLKLSFDWMERG